jgi:hypothetical protein
MRNGPGSIETAPEDSCSFSESVLAVFHFFLGKVEKMAGPPTEPAQSIDADAGVNLSDGKYAFPDPQHGRLTYG